MKHLTMQILNVQRIETRSNQKETQIGLDSREQDIRHDACDADSHMSSDIRQAFAGRESCLPSEQDDS